MTNATSYSSYKILLFRMHASSRLLGSHLLIFMGGGDYFGPGFFFLRAPEPGFYFFHGTVLDFFSPKNLHFK